MTGPHSWRPFYVSHVMTLQDKIQAQQIKSKQLPAHLLLLVGEMVQCIFNLYQILDDLTTNYSLMYHICMQKFR